MNTPFDVQAHLNSLADQWDQAQAEALWRACGRDVLQLVAAPFGLGKVLSAWDRAGGQVDTVHNVRNSVFVTAAEQKRYEERGAYDSKQYHAHHGYVQRNTEATAARKAGTLTDAYTGHSFTAQTHKCPQGKHNLDHVVSAKEVHDDAGRVLAGLNGEALANHESNLQSTCASINKSKRDKSATGFAQSLDAQRQSRSNRINNLQQRASRSAAEEAELRKLNKLDDVDTQRLREADARARERMDQEVNAAYYGSAKFASAQAAAGAKQGALAGAQRAFGIVLMEFFSRVMQEIRDWCRRGQVCADRWSELSMRCKRVAKACEAKLTDAWAAAKEGFVAGFFSSLVTTLINCMTTTGKRAVRILREGGMALVSCLRTLLIRPEGTSLREASHAAIQVLMVGSVTVGGVLIEQWLEIQLAGLIFLGPIAQALIAVITGAVTALAVCFCTFFLNRADVLGVIQERRDRGVEALLDESIARREAALMGQLAW